MSTAASRACSIPSMTSWALPARSPTVGLTCASAILIHSIVACGASLPFEAVSYFERLRALARGRQSMLCVGLDPDRIEGGAAGALRHCLEVVRQTEEHVCCFKPNSAFWEQYGPDGWSALMELRAEAGDTPFLFDAKRGDMDNTMRAYARAVFQTLGMDAATVNSYPGSAPRAATSRRRCERRGTAILRRVWWRRAGASCSRQAPRARPRR